MEKDKASFQASVSENQANIEYLEGVTTPKIEEIIPVLEEILRRLEKIDSILEGLKFPFPDTKYLIPGTESQEFIQ